MILSAGLSPAWQQILRFDSLRIGEVNRAQEAWWCASGKVINVAVAAAALGEQAALISAIGGITGDAIQRELELLRVQAEWIQTDVPTRVCTTLLDAAGVTTELVENMPDVAEAVLEDFVDRFRIYANVADVTVLTGSLPGNAPQGYCGRLLRSIPAKFILDVRGPALEDCLPFNPLLVKPNRQELAATLGTSLESEGALLAGMRTLNDRGAQWAVVSDGARGLWAVSDGVAFRFLAPQVQTVNPIGCGDCLAAGIAMELRHDGDVVTAIRLGMGAAACNAEQLLPARLQFERSVELAEQVEIEEIELPA